LDVVDPDDTYSLALFLRQAREAVDRILERGRTPLLVGGTGQYVWGFVEGWQVPEAPPDPALRARLEERVRSQGLAPLLRELESVAPAVAERVDRRNPRRVIRALEVSLATGGSHEMRGRRPPPYRFLLLGLHLPRQELYRRADERVEAMMAAGWLEEVQRLLDMGYGLDLPSMSGIGYLELGLHLAGRMSLEEAIRRVKARTHRFIRRQGAWFRPSDPRIRWFPSDEEGHRRALEAAVAHVD